MRHAARTTFCLSALVALVALVAAGCTTASTRATTSSTHVAVASPVDCARVRAELTTIATAQGTMVDNGEVTASQFARSVATIAGATRWLAHAATGADQGEVRYWLTQTEEYALQIRQGAASGKSVAELLEVAAAYSTTPYQRAAQGVASYFEHRCPGQ